MEVVSPEHGGMWFYRMSMPGTSSVVGTAMLSAMLLRLRRESSFIKGSDERTKGHQRLWIFSSYNVAPGSGEEGGVSIQGFLYAALNVKTENSVSMVSR